jgi:hypothetical protein
MILHTLLGPGALYVARRLIACCTCAFVNVGEGAFRFRVFFRGCGEGLVCRWFEESLVEEFTLFLVPLLAGGGNHMVSS